MNFYLIGVDYQSASLEIREEICRRRKEIFAYWHNRKPKATAVLFTCNRIEIYGLIRDFNGFSKEALAFKQCFKGLFENAYIKLGQAGIFEHLLRLACGLKSQLKGETQILQQLKAWPVLGLLPQPLSELLEQILPLAENIRRQTGLDQTEINIANIVFGDLVKRIGINEKMQIIIIGTGKIAQLIADNRPESAQLHFISHRNLSKARLLARQSQGTVETFSDLPDLLLTVDSLISATSSPHFVVNEEHFLKQNGKRQRPVYLYDLAIPRDIEPKVGQLPGIFLQNLNDVASVFEQDNQRRQSKISLAEYLVTEKINSYKDGLDGANYPSGYAPQSIGVKAG